MNSALDASPAAAAEVHVLLQSFPTQLAHLQSGHFQVRPASEWLTWKPDDYFQSCRDSSVHLNLIYTLTNRPELHLRTSVRSFRK